MYIIDLKMGEPVLVNPNSYDSVKTVLDEYKKHCHKIGEARQWVMDLLTEWQTS